CLIFAPLKGYNEPEILRSRLNRFGPISADAGQAAVWHHQAKRFGGYSTETRRLIRSTIEEAMKKRTENDIPPSLLSNDTKAKALPKRKLVLPGARLLRDWNGKTHVVDVIEGGYVFEAKVYPSLTAIAGKITGVHWSGPRFFGL
ncbi:DUF2924 domain-containing protein, partial [Mesorhizobium sp. Root552]|uniref:DUF2924 domain-containing protein n=1 Tax=Mesorhizobium sp. Root552 TaxID=1736555 RepID=UPI000ADA1A25